MDFGSPQLYTFESWSSNGVPIADISPLCQNRRYTLERNEAELLTFDMDLFQFEDFCANINADPYTVLDEYATDIKVKRNGQYLFGTQVVDIAFNLAAGGAQPTFSVMCEGYLNLFTKRWTDGWIYTQQDRCFVVGDLITQTQAIPNGNMGVTLDPSLYMTGVPWNRTYARDNIKRMIQEPTQFTDARFDIGFDYNKVFHTYQQIGSKRTDISFVYGGAGSNIVGFYLDRNASSLYNQIIGLGSGFGKDQVTTTEDDVPGQLNKYLRQDLKQYNGIADETVLIQNAKADLALEKDTLEMPQITLTTNDLRGIDPFLGIGDRIPVKVLNHSFLAHTNGIYRIEKMMVTLDSNDFENIVCYFDNFAVNPNT
jgi:hypothetical protein